MARSCPRVNLGSMRLYAHPCDTQNLQPQKNTCSEALAVHNRGAGLVVLTLRDPHLLEGAQGGKDGAANPHGVLPLRWCDNLDLHGRRSQSSELLGHALADAREHGGASGEHHVGVEILTNIHIALHDRLEGGIMTTAGLLADEARL